MILKIHWLLMITKQHYIITGHYFTARFFLDIVDKLFVLFFIVFFCIYNDKQNVLTWNSLSTYKQNVILRLLLTLIIRSLWFLVDLFYTILCLNVIFCYQFVVLSFFVGGGGSDTGGFSYIQWILNISLASLFFLWWLILSVEIMKTRCKPKISGLLAPPYKQIPL